MTTAEQRAAALDAANQARRARSKLRDRVGAGEVATWKVIEDPPAFMVTTTVFDYITWLPGVGKTRGSLAFKLLRKARVQPYCTIGDLTPLQRERLVKAIHEHAHPRVTEVFRRPLRAAMRGEGHPAERNLT